MTDSAKPTSKTHALLELDDGQPVIPGSDTLKNVRFDRLLLRRRDEA